MGLEVKNLVHIKINRIFALKFSKFPYVGGQWLSGRVLDSRPRGCGFEPNRCHCIVSLSKNINPSLVLVQPRKTCPFITERLLMGGKESNQTNKQIKVHMGASWLSGRMLDWRPRGREARASEASLHYVLEQEH